MSFRGRSTRKGVSTGSSFEGGENELDAAWVAENTADKVPEELAEDHAPEAGPNCI